MRSPWVFQEEAIEFALQGNVIVGDKCGLGKTLIAIEVYKRWRVQPNNLGPCLYITTVVGKGQVVDEILEQDPGTPIQVDSVAGIRKDSVAYVVTHLEHLPKLLTEASKIYWSMIILDEAHKIKNRKAKRSQTPKKLTTRKALAMSATITSKFFELGDKKVPNPTELWSVLNFLEPEKFRGFFAFRQKYIDLQKHPWLGHFEEMGLNPEHLLEYTTLLNKYFISREKRQVAKFLPPITQVRVRLSMNKKQRRLYDNFRQQASEDIVVKVEDMHPQAVLNVLAEYHVLQKICEYPELVSDTVTGVKFDWLSEWFESNPDETVLVITRYVRTAQVLSQLFDTVVIAGDVNTYERSERPRKIFASIQAVAGVYDMPWIDNVIYVGFHWSPIIMEQSRDRIDRINITSPKTVYYLACEDSIDEVMLDTFVNNSSMKVALQDLQNHLRGGD